jgi:GTP:adenosylcobinamide-phosphate guanylyltransferase
VLRARADRSRRTRARGTPERAARDEDSRRAARADARLAHVLNAIVLAGGRPDAVAALEPGVANKAFVHVGGLTLVERTLRAVRTVPRIERIIVVAPNAALTDPALTGADETRPDGPRMIESLRSGLAGLAPDEPLLVTASDLPILTRAALDEAIDAALARDLDLGYTCVERRYHDARFPALPHTWARMRDGSFCGGGAVVLKPRVMARLETLLDQLGSARKSPLRLTAIFGWGTLARFALGRLSIAAAEARASHLIDARAGAIRCTHPEIAVNVDRPTDVALANALIRERVG